MMSFIHTNYAILTLWPMSPKHHLLDLWSCEIAMAFAVVAVAGAERISAVLKHDNWPNTVLALCASRRVNLITGTHRRYYRWRRSASPLP